MSDTKTRLEQLHNVNEALGDLIGSYEKGDPIQAELREVRKHILTLVVDPKNEDVTKELHEAFGTAYKDYVKTRIRKAMNRAIKDDKIAEAIYERKALEEILDE